MAIKLNAGIRNFIVDSMIGSLGSTTAQLKLYSGTVPASADTAPTGTLLCTIDFSQGGWSAASAGSASLLAAGSGVANASGTAGYGSLQDTTGTYRIYGSVGTTGTDFIISGTAIANGATITCSQCTISQPAT